MTSPGITVGNQRDFTDVNSFYLSGKPKDTGSFPNGIHGSLYPEWKTTEQRFDQITDWAISVLTSFKVERALLEGYAFGGKGQVFHIGECTGLLKHKMYKAGIEFDVVPPASVKMSFTGKGNSNKIALHESFVERTGINLAKQMGKKPHANPVSDVVDSFAIYLHGYEEFFIKG